MDPYLPAGMAISLAALNFALYFIFRKFILNTGNAGMKFLVLNIAKDLGWIIYWIVTAEKTNTVFFTLAAVFLPLSFILYYVAVRDLNKR